MWSYYGAKTNIVDYYPKPKYGKIIEPFAGTARYALKYFDREVLLVDKYEVIVKIWKWLQQCSVKDILSLPRKMDPGSSLNDISFDCEEAKMLMGFLVSKGVESPRSKATDWVTIHRPNFINFSLQRIARNLFKIKHWQIVHQCFSDIENQKATWFVDPPYQFGGHSYVESNRKINFNELALWSMARIGQVIVCENQKADWMDFVPMNIQFGRTGIQREVIWSNKQTAFDNQQLTLL